MDKGLRVRDYSVSYATGRGPLQVLEGVGLTVGPGEVLGLVGESGSGKSTLAYAVMRTLRAPVAAESGDIALGGVPLLGRDENRLSSMRGNRITPRFLRPLRLARSSAKFTTAAWLMRCSDVFCANVISCLRS